MALMRLSPELVRQMLDTDLAAALLWSRPVGRGAYTRALSSRAQAFAAAGWAVWQLLREKKSNKGRRKILVAEPSLTALEETYLIRAYRCELANCVLDKHSDGAGLSTC